MFLLHIFPFITHVCHCNDQTSEHIIFEERDGQAENLKEALSKFEESTKSEESTETESEISAEAINLLQAAQGKFTIDTVFLA